MRAHQGFSRILVISLAAVVLGAPVLARDIGSFDRTLAVTGSTELEVETGSGHITVRPGAGNTVRIHGIISGGDWSGPDAEQRAREIETNPPISQSGNTIHIDRLTGDRGNNLSISYEIEAPRSTSVRARTGSGSESFEGMEGPVDATTGSGGIRVSGAGSDVRVKTGSGSIDLDGAKGRVDAMTGSGSIRVANVTAPVTARTGSGTVSVTLPASSGFDLRARTGSGGVSIGPSMTTENFSSNRREVEGKIRGGGPLLDLTTGSGGVRVD